MKNLLDATFLILIYAYMILLPILPSKFKVHSIPVNGDAILALIMLLYFIKILLDWDTRKRFVRGIKNFFKDKLTIFIFIFCLTMFISISYSQNKSLALNESMRFFTYVFLFFVIKYELHDKNSIKLLLRVYLISCFLVFFAGVIDHYYNLKFLYHSAFYDKSRLEGTMENSNNLGAFAVISIFPLLVLMLEDKKIINKIVYFIILSLGVLNLAFAASRNSWLAVVAGFAFLTILFSYKFIFSFLFLGGAAYFIPKVHTRLKQIFDTAQNESRIKIWKLAIKVIKDHPLKGVGNGNYYSVYPEYIKRYPELVNTYDSVQVYHPHNIFLKVQCELGIIGLLSFIGIIVSIAAELKKVIVLTTDNFNRSFYKGFSASFTAFLCMNLVDNFFSAPKVIAFFWILIAVTQSAGIDIKQ